MTELFIRTMTATPFTAPEGIEKTDSTRTLMMNAAAKMEKKNIVNTTDKSTYSFDRSKSGNVVVNVSMKEGQHKRC